MMKLLNSRIFYLEKTTTTTNTFSLKLSVPNEKETTKDSPGDQTIYETKLNQTKPREIYNLRLCIISDVFMSTLQTTNKGKGKNHLAL